MIITLRAENIYNFVSGLSAITALCEIFSLKPDENSTPEGSYCYINIVSNSPSVYSNQWYLMKTARVSFHIICKESLWADDTPERVLMDIVDTISNNLIGNGHSSIVDWFICFSIVEDTISPIFQEDNRHYVVKDYLFNYSSISDV